MEKHSKILLWPVRFVVLAGKIIYYLFYSFFIHCIYASNVSFNFTQTKLLYLQNVLFLAMVMLYLKGSSEGLLYPCVYISGKQLVSIFQHGWHWKARTGSTCMFWTSNYLTLTPNFLFIYLLPFNIFSFRHGQIYYWYFYCFLT